jgi:hypothetical protein
MHPDGLKALGEAAQHGGHSGDAEWAKVLPSDLARMNLEEHPPTQGLAGGRRTQPPRQQRAPARRQSIPKHVNLGAARPTLTLRGATPRMFGAGGCHLQALDR